VKYAQRLDYARLAEVLHERGMLDVETVRDLLQASNNGGTPFPEAFVEGGLVSDWDISRIVAEIFNLPFLPVDFTEPNVELLELFDQGFLVENSLVPVSRFGNVLTLAMPALVQADVLGLLSAECDLLVIPVVGSVSTNKRWLKEHCGDAAASGKSSKPGIGSDWSNLFDEGEAAVQLALEGDEEFEAPEFTDDGAALAEALDAAGLDGEGVLEFTEDPGLDDVASLTDGLGLVEDDDEQESDVETLELPPMPDFG
jgi:hypothetical protein